MIHLYTTRHKTHTHRESRETERERERKKQRERERERERERQRQIKRLGDPECPCVLWFPVVVPWMVLNLPADSNLMLIS